MVKHTQKICRLLPTNYLSVFDHFVLLALKGLMIVADVNNLVTAICLLKLRSY